MSSYWEARAAERMYEAMQDAEEFAEAIAKMYLQASLYIEQQLDAIFEKFQSRHGLSLEEARQLIQELKDKEDIEELKRLLRNRNLPEQARMELLKQLESAAYGARMQRLIVLQKQIDIIMQKTYQQEIYESDAFYADLAKKSYYKEIFDIQQRIGVSFDFAHVHTKQINSVLSMNWSGKHYSKRIWEHTQKLAEQLKEEILLNLLTGRTERETAERIRQRFASGSAHARRLIRTESNFVSTELNFRAYEAAGIEEYQYLATLDLRTSQICRSLDGKIFKVKNREPGVNCPPMHPWCRSTTISVVDRAYIDSMTRSAADPKTGKTIKVPRSMRYQEWYEKYVEAKG